MNRTAPAGDCSRPAGEPRPLAPSPPRDGDHSPLRIPQGGRPPGPLRTPPGGRPPGSSVPPLIRISVPAISIDCGTARYRTHPMELVAAPLPEREVANAECPVSSVECASANPPGGRPPGPPSPPHSPPSGEVGLRSPRPVSSPFEAQSSALEVRSSPSPLHPSPSALAPPPSPYSLRKGLGHWLLVFQGRDTVLRPERGLLYVAWLLHHPPPQPIHAIDLAAQIPDLYRTQLGLTALADPATGHPTPLPSHARLQERSLALDDADSLRALHRKEQKLEALLDDDSASEPEKAEALRDLEAIAAFLRQHARRSRDAAHRTVHAVREAVRRFHVHLLKAKDAQGQPHPVLRPFADHLQQHLLIPSTRYAGRGSRYARSDQAGCFTYEPPLGIRWSV